MREEKNKLLSLFRGSIDLEVSTFNKVYENTKTQEYVPSVVYFGRYGNFYGVKISTQNYK
jgi:hypothetical protein